MYKNQTIRRTSSTFSHLAHRQQVAHQPKHQILLLFKTVLTEFYIPQAFPPLLTFYIPQGVWHYWSKYTYSEKAGQSNIKKPQHNMCVLLAQQPRKKEQGWSRPCLLVLWGSNVQYLLQTPRKLSKSYSFCFSFDRKSKVVLLVSHLTLSKVFGRLCTFPAQQRPLTGQIPKAGKAQKMFKF